MVGIAGINSFTSPFANPFSVSNTGFLPNTQPFGASAFGQNASSFGVATAPSARPANSGVGQAYAAAVQATIPPALNSASVLNAYNAQNNIAPNPNSTSSTVPPTVTPPTVTPQAASLFKGIQAYLAATTAAPSNSAPTSVGQTPAPQSSGGSRRRRGLS